MKRILSWIAAIGVCIAVVMIIIFFAWLSWQTFHAMYPTAPFWVWLLHTRK
ncbi:MAG: hypothetical protein WC455_15925 [Dehalococcoidia bacterium]